MTEAQQDAAIASLQSTLEQTRELLQAARVELNFVHVHCRDLVDILQRGGFNIPEFDSIPPTA